MHEADNSSAPYGRYEKDESIFGLSDLASLTAFIYLLFFLLVLVIYSANPFEPAVFGFYKLSVFFQVVSFFGIFFVPTLLTYFALDLTKSVGHTVVVLGYPFLVLGAAAILNIPDAPLFAALSGLVLFAFYFLAGLNRSTIERQQRASGARRAVRQNQRAPAQRQLMSQYAPPSRPSDFRRDAKPQYGSSDSFLSRLDRFLDRYDYIDGQAVPKSSRRSVRYERDQRRGGR